MVACLVAGCPAGTAAPRRDFGVDVSHYQGGSGISQSAWNQMFTEGKRFVFVKASEGLTGPDDPAMRSNVSRAVEAGLWVGVYHYCHPENRPTPEGAALEADHFLTYAGSAIGPGRLRPVLDLEGNSAELSAAELTDWVIAFCNEIIAQRGLGAAPILYMNRSCANGGVDDRLAAYDLWLACPTDADPSVDDPPPTSAFPRPLGVFNNWCFWQYTSTGTAGGINPIDMDVCHNEYKPLAALLIPAPGLFAAIKLEPNASFQFAFTNLSVNRYTLSSVTNMSLPSVNWATTVQMAMAETPGQFECTEISPTAPRHGFYRVRSP